MRNRFNSFKHFFRWINAWSSQIYVSKWKPKICGIFELYAVSLHRWPPSKWSHWERERIVNSPEPRWKFSVKFFCKKTKKKFCVLLLLLIFLLLQKWLIFRFGNFLMANLPSPLFIPVPLIHRQQSFLAYFRHFLFTFWLKLYKTKSNHLEMMQNTKKIFWFWI